MPLIIILEEEEEDEGWVVVQTVDTCYSVSMRRRPPPFRRGWCMLLDSIVLMLVFSRVLLIRYPISFELV